MRVMNCLVPTQEAVKLQDSGRQQTLFVMVTTFKCNFCNEAKGDLQTIAPKTLGLDNLMSNVIVNMKYYHLLSQLLKSFSPAKCMCRVKSFHHLSCHIHPCDPIKVIEI